ncbi:MAG: glycosyltransferase family 9 protein [Bacteroidota bacterium]
MKPLPKALIVRFSSIGDIVLTSPVVRCLKLQTGMEIHYLTKQSFTNILTANPHISKVYTIRKDLSEVLPDLQQENYDYLIDLHHNLRTFLLKTRLWRVKSYAFPKLNFEKWLLTNFKINRLPHLHIVDRYMETVRSLGVQNDGKGLDFFIKEEVKAAGIPFTKYVALPIGAGQNTKALTIEKIVQFCQLCPYPIVLLGGKNEIAKAEQIIQQLASSAAKKVINQVGKCSLAASAAIVKKAQVVVTGDTGLMHIAAAFRKPIVSVWGNTIPEFGMSPYFPKGVHLNHSIQVANLSCRPCSKIGYERCPKGHFRCIAQIEVVEIMAAVDKFWHLKPAP